MDVSCANAALSGGGAAVQVSYGKLRECMRSKFEACVGISLGPQRGICTVWRYSQCSSSWTGRIAGTSGQRHRRTVQ